MNYQLWTITLSRNDESSWDTHVSVAAWTKDDGDTMRMMMDEDKWDMVDIPVCLGPSRSVFRRIPVG